MLAVIEGVIKVQVKEQEVGMVAEAIDNSHRSQRRKQFQRSLASIQSGLHRRYLKDSPNIRSFR